MYEGWAAAAAAAAGKNGHAQYSILNDWCGTISEFINQMMRSQSPSSRCKYLVMFTDCCCFLPISHRHITFDQTVTGKVFLADRELG